MTISPFIPFFRWNSKTWYILNLKFKNCWDVHVEIQTEHTINNDENKIIEKENRTFCYYFADNECFAYLTEKEYYMCIGKYVSTDQLFFNKLKLMMCNSKENKDE